MFIIRSFLWHSLNHLYLHVSVCLVVFVQFMACEDPVSQVGVDAQTTTSLIDQGYTQDPILENEMIKNDQQVWTQDQSMNHGQDMGHTDMSGSQAMDQTMSSSMDQSNHPSSLDMELCGQWVEEAGRALLPVDLIWVIDSSPSMQEEIEQIQNNLNTFTQRITDSGLDIRVVVVASEADYYGDSQNFLGVCIPPPLSAADQCPDVDGNRYYHARINVHSRDAFERFIDAYDGMAGFLRPYAYKHVVFVTDDNAGWGVNAMDWMAFVQSTMPNQFMRGLQVHSVVDLVGYQNNCAFDESCSCGEERGQAYIDLSEQTEGLIYSVCETDWNPLFERLEQQVYVGSQLTCTYAIPPEIAAMPDADTLINVYWSASAEQAYVLVPQVDNAQACTGDVGWYYDRTTDPATIQLCPTSCDADQGAVRIEFGCMVVKR